MTLGTRPNFESLSLALGGCAPGPLGLSSDTHLDGAPLLRTLSPLECTALLASLCPLAARLPAGPRGACSCYPLCSRVPRHRRLLTPPTLLQSPSHPACRTLLHPVPLRLNWPFVVDILGAHPQTSACLHSPTRGRPLLTVRWTRACSFQVRWHHEKPSRKPVPRSPPSSTGMTCRADQHWLCLGKPPALTHTAAQSRQGEQLGGGNPQDQARVPDRHRLRSSPRSFSAAEGAGEL